MVLGMRAFVVRLLDDQLRLGQVVGRVQDVESGNEAVVRDVDELVRFFAAPTTVDLNEGDRDPVVILAGPEESTRQAP